MLKDFNLIITTARGNEEDACSEIWYLLGKIGDENAEVEKTGITGLITARTILNPFNAVAKFKEILKQEPQEFRYTLRIIPIEKVVRTDLSQIEEIVAGLSSRIAENETFRITVEKRFTTLSTKDIIEASATKISRRVDLERPDKIVLIEVVNGFTGISLLGIGDIISVTKERATSYSSLRDEESHTLDD
jgi:tRNA acetyltransferase TAN1